MLSNLRKMGYRATLKAEPLALEEWVELHVDLVLVQPEEGDQGNVQHGNTRQRQDPRQQLRELLPKDLKIETNPRKLLLMLKKQLLKLVILEKLGVCLWNPRTKSI